MTKLPRKSLVSDTVIQAFKACITVLGVRIFKTIMYIFILILGRNPLRFNTEQYKKINRNFFNENRVRYKYVQGAQQN